MNLTDEQKQALTTLPVGAAVVRWLMNIPKPFLIQAPLFPVREGSVSDEMVKSQMRAYPTDSRPNRTPKAAHAVIPPIPPPDKKVNEKTEANDRMKSKDTRPPSPRETLTTTSQGSSSNVIQPPKMTSEATRFLADVSARPLSTTVARYQRLRLSRRKGNAIRQDLADAGVIEAVPVATPLRPGRALSTDGLWPVRSVMMWGLIPHHGRTRVWNIVSGCGELSSTSRARAMTWRRNTPWTATA